MASWPPPPPPRQPHAAPQNTFPQAPNVSSNNQGEKREGSAATHGFPPPPHVVAQSMASMNLNNNNNGRSFPTPPHLYSTQQQQKQHSCGMPPPPAPTMQHQPPPALSGAPPKAATASSMPHPHAFHRVSPTHHHQSVPPPPSPPGPSHHVGYQQHAPAPTQQRSYPQQQQQQQQHVAPPPPPQAHSYPAPQHQAAAFPHQQRPHYPTQQQQQVRPPPPPIHGRPQMNMNGGMQPPSKPKIDPSQIPRPPLFTSPQDGTEHIPIYYPKEALHHAEPRPPPPADSRFLTFDDGNAAPQLIRSTVYAIPMDRQVLRHSLPMGLLCTPLNIASAEYVPRHKVLPDGELQEWRDAQRIPLVSQQVVPKCRHCHAYANPYWGQDGICNFCQTRNSSLQLVGFTTKYGTVEYEVGGPYITRKTPVQPVFLYAIDATCPNLPLYIPMLCNVGKSMAQHYQRQGAGRLAPRIATCLVGSFGIVLCTLETNGSISLSIMSDVTEQPFSPLPLEQWTFDMSSNQSVRQWEMLTNQLWNAWQPFIKELDQKSPYGPNGFSLSCGGAALAFMADALAETGGRATLLTWRRPNFGVGAIRDREQMNTSNYTSEKTERTLYTPLQIQKDLKDKVDVNSATFYKELGATCAKNRVCIDILVHTPPTVVPFLDLGTLGELCRITSGRIKWIRSRRWKEQLQEELQRSVLSFVGRDAVFKVRCSEGLQVKSYLSCTAPGVTMENGIAESPELEMTCVDPTTCIAVDLEHRVGGIRKDAQIVYFQSALLYTTSAGERRVRVSTLALRTTKEPTTVFRSADFSAITTIMTRKTITNLWQPVSDIEIPLQEARVDVTMQCIDILSNYRRYTSAHALPIGQLILPDRLQLLPLYCMSLLKSVMLRSSLPKRGSGVRVVKPSPTADERAYGLFFGSSVIPALAMLLVHPHVFPILHLQDGDGEWQIPEYSLASSEIEKTAAHAYIQLPAPVNPSITCLEDNGVYLIDDGFTIFVYLGKDVPEDVSGPLLIKDVDGNYAVSNDSAFGKQIRRLIWQMQTFCAVGEGSESCLRPTVAPVEVVLGDENHNKDPLEEKVMTLMVDDSSSTEHDYIDFLVQIHKSVRSKTQDS